MLYQGSERYVSLTDEIKLLNNYIDLEKLRYGERVIIDFEYKTEQSIEIAPLILLTLLENAFKHGVKEAIGSATIQIRLRATQKEFFFEIRNSKPRSRPENDNDQNNAIGLLNIKKQLDFLYPQRNNMEIDDSVDSYCVTLELKLHEV